MVFILLILVLWCRRSVTAADWYAQHVYPVLSKGLSWLASPFSFSVTEILIVLLVVLFIVRVVRIFTAKERRGRRVWRAVRLLLWIYVWFYAAWGINYFRSDLFARTESVPMPYEEAEFHEFLAEFSEQLNTNWCDVEEIDREAVEKHVKTWYASLPPETGLAQPRSWQRPKRLTFNRIYSAVGVLGYIGPFFDEMHVNHDVLPLEYPFIYAHEYSHVLGVSNEAEANFWAFENCRHSEDPAIRYSAWYMLLTYTAGNIHSLLDEEAYQAWRETLRPEVYADLDFMQSHWQSLRWAWLSRMQHRIYDVFLRSNRIADGTKNYGQVLRLVLTLSDLHDHEEPEEHNEPEAHGQKG